MTAARTDMDRLQEMVRLHRLRHGLKRLAAMLKMSPKTERAYRAAFLAEGLLDVTSALQPPSNPWMRARSCPGPFRRGCYPGAP